MTVILCFGDPLRGDAAVAWRVAAQLRAEAMRALVVACDALVEELAPVIASAEVAIFVHASAGGTPGQLNCARINQVAALPPPQDGYTPASLLAVAAALYGDHTVGYQITIAAGQFDIGAPLSPPVVDAVGRAVTVIEGFAAQVAGTRSRKVLKLRG